MRCFANIDRQTLQQPRMKYWESAADKLHRCWLVMGLLQCRDTTRLAMDR